jgi:hypothetical protein
MSLSMTEYPTSPLTIAEHTKYQFSVSLSYFGTYQIHHHEAIALAIIKVLSLTRGVFERRITLIPSKFY